MITICRAEDGHVFQVDATWRDIDRTGIGPFVQEHTHADGTSIAYLSDGTRLGDDNIAELAGASDQTIWVYDTSHLSLPLPSVLESLALPLPSESNAASPASSPDTIRESNHPNPAHILSLLRTQSLALPPAFHALSRALLSLTSTHALLAPIAHSTLTHQAQLLAALPADLTRLPQVRIHPEFLGGRKGRSLGDYVAAGKMSLVGEACARAHQECASAVGGVEEALLELERELDGVREAVGNLDILDEAESSPMPTAERMAELYNAHTAHALPLLRRIAVLNAALLPLPPQLSSIQELTANKDGAAGKWGHVERLHGMAHAYGATLLEALRRRAFAGFFWARVGTVVEVFAGVSAAERRRRHAFRSETRGTLPFATPRLDGADDVPSVDFVRTGGSAEESGYAVERADVDAFLRTLAETGADANTLNTLRQRVAKMDSLEAGFERVVARSLLSNSRLSLSHSRLADVDADGLMRELEDTRAGRDELVRALAELRAREEAQGMEVERLRRLMAEAEEERGRALQEAQEAAHEREQEIERLLLEAQIQARELDDVRAADREKVRELDRLRDELRDVRAQLAEARAAEQHSQDIDVLRNAHANDLESIRAEHAQSTNTLRSTHAQVVDSLKATLATARTELDTQRREKERMLKTQTAEADRVLRDHIAEADGDRAVLEHQLAGLRATLDDAQHELRDTQGDGAGLREELVRVERELRDARHVERVLREDVRAGRAGEEAFETRLEESGRLVAQMLDVALAFRAAHVRALATAQALAPSAAKARNLSESVFAPGSRVGLGVNALPGAGSNEEPEPIDPGDPAGALEVLRAVDHDHFLDEIRRTIRKWQKQCKEYRERAKGKISFRNFGEGDLALFLPTRNSVAKPWAAFNVSFPHYFLQATGHLAEQLKTREWIVARITSIAERVVDQTDPTSNPYGLGDGVKYYMLQVEDWTQPSQNQKRRQSNANSAPNLNASTNSKRRNSHSNNADLAPLSSSPLATSISPPNPNAEGLGGLSLSLSPPPLPGASQRIQQLPAEPPQISQAAEAPDHFEIVRARARTRSPPPAGPSSLSRLLAQAPSSGPDIEAPPDSPSHLGSPFIVEPQDPDQTQVHVSSPLPITTPLPELEPPGSNKAQSSPKSIAASPPPPSPSTGAGSLPRNAHIAGAPSPLRSGSRASRASRMSSTSFPAVAKAKAAPTIALSGAGGTIPDASPPRSAPSSRPQTPSPGEEASDGLANMPSVAGAGALHRRRTSNYHTPSPLSGASGAKSGGALASLANSWGVAFGRKKTGDGAGREESLAAGATEILKRF